MSSPSNPSQENIDYARTVNVARMHSAAAREKSEPEAKPTPVSLWVVVFIGALGIIAGGYFQANTGSSLGSANKLGYSYALTYPEGAGGGAATLSEEELHLPDNWKMAGKAIYAQCVACHSANGEGQPGLYPPLKGSEFVIKGEKRLAAILQHGITGALTVNGKPYNGQMQPLGAGMTDKQLAQLLTYIRNEWGNQASVIYEDQIKALRKELGNRPAYTETELRAIPEDANAPASEWVEKLKNLAAPAATPAAK